MVYGDLQIFDLIIFAGIAVFLIYRLRNVLGKRTGLEKQNRTIETSTIQMENVKKSRVPYKNCSKIMLRPNFLIRFFFLGQLRSETYRMQPKLWSPELKQTGAF